MKKIIAAIATLCCSAFHLSAQQKSHISANHIAFFVVDLNKSAFFYQQIIGLDTLPEPFHDGKHVWLTTHNGVAIHLIEGAAAKKEYFKNNHVCFSVAALEPFTATLLKNKLVWEDGSGKKNSITTRPDGVHQLWLQDPDGYWIEINDAKF